MFPIRNTAVSRVKRFTPADRFNKKILKFFSGFTPDADMVVRPEQAGLKLAVRGEPEAVAERTELGVVQRPDDFHFGPVKTIFFPVVHAARDNPF